MKQQKNRLEACRRAITERLAAARGYLSSEVISFSQLMRMMMPIFWEQAFLAFLAVFSLWLLSFDGENSIAVVNMISVVNKVFTSACLGIATGGTVLVAQNVGAGRREAAGRSMMQTIGLAVVLSAVAGGVLVGVRVPLIGFLLSGAEREILSQAVLYFTGFCLSFPFYAFYQSLAGAMRGWGRTATAWRITLFVNCLELALIAVFLLALGWGVLGITLAMVLARLAGACLAAVILIRERRELAVGAKSFARPDKAILRGVLMIAVPLALEQVFFNGGKAVSQRFIAGYGTAHMAANGVINGIFDIVNLPQITLRETLVTVVGMCIGCGRLDLARRYVYRFLRTIRVVMVAMMPLTIPLAALLLYGYGLSGESNRLTMLSLGLIYTFGPLFLAGSFAIPAGLRAGGDAGYVSAVALCCMWGVRVTLSWLFAGVLGMGVVGINLAMVIEWVVRDQLYRVRLKGERWYQYQLI